MTTIQTNQRISKLERSTRETQILLELALDGSRELDINTGLGFFDHMLTALAYHAKWDLRLRVVGDLEVDDHHTIEDTALALGQAFDVALGDKKGIRRFANAYAPLDESLCRTVVDISGRPTSVVDLQLVRDSIGPVACENLVHFFNSFATAAKLTLHVDVLRGENDHHKSESAFKSLALSLRSAVEVIEDSHEVPSTKGAL